MAIESIIASNMRRIRRRMGLTQGQLADRINVRQATISDWETGKNIIDSVYLKRVADALGVTTDEFYVDVDESEIPRLTA